MSVLSPVSGRCADVSEMPDEVFATGLVGPGISIDPERHAQCALSPIEGTLVKLFPHAFLVRSDGGPAVLVHLGIDTVRLAGDGFEPRAVEGHRVAAAQEVVTWDPSYVEGLGLSPLVAVVVLECPTPSVVLREVDATVRAAEPVFDFED